MAEPPIAPLIARRARRIFLVASIAWMLLLYARVLAVPFAAYDDPGNILNNSALSSWTTTLRYFTNPAVFATDITSAPGSTSAPAAHDAADQTSDSAGAKPQSYYRPVYWLSLALDRHLWGLSPAGFHASSLLLHWLDACLFFALLCRLRVATLTAATASLLWLALPIQSEAVVWISARAYPLTAFFLLLGALCAHNWLASRRALFLFLYFLAAFAALLTHEAGILIFPLILLTGLAFAKAQPAENARAGSMRAAMLAAPAVVALVAYVAVRLLVIKSTQPASIRIAPFGLYLWKYIAWILLPLHLSVERSTSMPPAHWSLAAALAWIATLGLCALAFILRRKAPPAAAGIAWLVFALAPFCGITYIYQGMAERFTYFASAGAALILAVLFFRLYAIACAGDRRKASTIYLTYLSIVVFVAWLVWGVVKLWHRETEWSDPVALYNSSLQANPRSAKLYFNLGDAYLAQDDLTNAAASYRKSLSITPGNALVVLDLAATLQKEGDYNGAERTYVRAINLAPMRDDAYCDLGVLYFERGQTAAAIQLLSLAIKISPDDPTANYDLAVAYQQSGRLNVAILFYKRVLQLKPGDPDTISKLRQMGALR